MQPADHRAITAATTGPTPAVAADHVTKRFAGGVVANDRVSFDVRSGEVHALLGENGAGKTTLCNILTGLYHPDEGAIHVDGRPIRLRSPHEAQAAGIFMVHQHLSLVESLTVTENVMLGWSRRPGFRYSPREADAEIAEIADRYHMRVDPRARIWQLSLGERQRIDILKALYRDARILILDEPTTVLTPAETDQLFSTVREMVAAGRSVIFISHKLPEVLAIASRVTILRKGRSVTTVETAATDARELARLMVGHDIASDQPRRAAGEAVAGGPGAAAVVPSLELTGICADGDFGIEVLRDVTLKVNPGEIVGIAGVAGNGQREFAEVVTGTRRHTRGSVRVAGEELPNGDPRWAIDHGVAHVPEDRMGTGVAPGLSLTENLILKSYRLDAPHAGPVLQMGAVGHRSTEMMEKYDIRASSSRSLVRQLSGGNVQKVVLARELESRPRVVIAASPTRGLDVGATEYVHGVLADAAASGVGIVLISEDLDEIVALSDRIEVFYEGRIVGTMPTAEATYEQIGLLMAGASGAAARSGAAAGPEPQAPR
jgi:general nucleoside transport system ATP-binding protein